MTDPDAPIWFYEIAEGGVTFDGRTYRAGDVFETADPCVMRAFVLTLHEQTGADLREKTPGTVDLLDEACPAGEGDGIGNTHDPQTDVPADPALDAGSGDVGADLGGPAPATSGELSTTSPGPGAPDSRGPAEQIYGRDAQDPADVEQRLADAGLDPEAIEDLMEAAARGDPAPGQPHPFRSRDETGGDAGDAAAADPVNLFTGEYTLRGVDLQMPGAGPELALIRVYASGRPCYGPFGFNWDHNFNVYLRELDGGAAAVWTGTLAEHVYRPLPDGRLEPPPGVFARLDPGLPEVGSYQLTHAGGTRWLFRRPDGWPLADRIPLERIADRAGAALRCSYDPAGRLAAVTDDAGRAIRFGYGQCGLLERVSDDAGRVVRYDHDASAEHLVVVISPSTQDNPDGLRVSYEYDVKAEHPALRHNIVRTWDPAGELVVENEFGADPESDDFNRVVRQIYLGEEHRYSATRLRYVAPGPDSANDAWLRVRYEPPGEGPRSYTFAASGNLLDERMRLIADGSYRIWATAYRYTGLGQLAQVFKPNGLALHYEYDEDATDPCDRGNLLRVRLTGSPLFAASTRVVASFEYGRFQLVTAQTDEAGAVTRYVYDCDRDPLGRGAGHLVEVQHPQATLPDGSAQAATETYVYEQGRRTGYVDAEGNRFAYAYHSSGLLARVSVEDQSIEVDYDRFGNASQVRLPGGASYAFDTDALGRVCRVRRPAVDGSTAEVVNRYGPAGTLVEQRLPRGALLDPVLADAFVRNDIGTDTVVLGANTGTPRRWTVERDWAGRTTRMVDPLGRTTRLRYDERGLLLERTRFAGTDEERTERFGYDRNGNLVRAVDPAGRVTEYGYDGFDRLVAESLHGTTVHYHYGVRDQLERVEVTGASAGPLGVTQRRYDERGRLVSQSQAGQTATFWHDRMSRIVKVVNQRGAELLLAVDALGRLRAVTDPAGNVTRWDYDRNGNLTAVTEQEVEPGSATPRSYVSSLGYDARCRLTSLRDPLGNTTTVAYDDRDLATSVTSPLGIRHDYRFDAAGALVHAAVTGHGHHFERDPAGRLVGYRDPAGFRTTYEYTMDDAWRRITAPDGSVRERRFGRDGAVASELAGTGRIRLVRGPDGSLHRLLFEPLSVGVADPAEVRYDRDLLGRAVQVSDGTSRLSIEYDEAGRIAVETLDGATVRRIHDDRTGQARLTYPDGRVDRYEYDQVGRLARIVLERAAPNPAAPLAAGTVLAEYEYAGTNRLARRRLANGSVTTYRYDAGRRLAGIEHHGPGGALLAGVEYLYDADSRRRFVRNQPAPGVAALVDLDDHGRVYRVAEGLTAGAIPSDASQAEADAFIAALAGAAGSREYHFDLDDADFRTAAVLRDGSGVTRRDFGAGGCHEIALASVPAPGIGPAVRFGYDPAGRRTADDRYLYRYDPLGRLREVRDAASQALRLRLGYDPLGRLRLVEHAGVATQLRHFQETVLQEETTGGVILAQHCWGAHPHELILRSTASTVHWGHQDGRLTLLAVSDGAGAAAERYGYAPFGEAGIWASDGVTARAASQTGVPPLFGAHRALGPAGLFHAGSRAYDAVTGNYLQRDRRGHTDSPNPYCYLGHDPVDLIDPGGEVLPLIAAFVIIGALSGAGYSFYEASEHPERYQSEHFSFRALGNTVAGSVIGATAGAAAHVVASFALGAVGGGTAAGGMAAGGAFGTGTLTLAQRFVIGGTMAVASGYIMRTGFHDLFPEYADPPSVGNMTFDYVTGGLAGPSSVQNLQSMVRDAIPASFAPRALGNNWRLMWRGQWLNRLTRGWLGGRYRYSPLNTFWETRIGRPGFEAVSKQYWRGEAEGKALHHLWISQRANLPRWLDRFRNAGWNMLETGGTFNSWMGRGALRDVKEWAFRGVVTGILGITGYGSYAATHELTDDQPPGGTQPGGPLPGAGLLDSADGDGVTGGIAGAADSLAQTADTGTAIK